MKHPTRKHLKGQEGNPMLLALSAMSPTTQGVLFLVAVILFVVAAVAARDGYAWLVPAGLACFAVVFCWQAFAAG